VTAAGGQARRGGRQRRGTTRSRREPVAELPV